MRATAAARGAIRDAGRWESVELDLVRMATAALGLAVPFGWGVLSHHPGDGAAATIGALLVSGSGHLGSLAQRVNDLLLGALAAAGCLLVGSILARNPSTTVLAIPVAAGVLALIAPLRPSITKAAAQGTVALVLSTALAEPGVPLLKVVCWFLVGAAYAGSLTLAGHGIAGRIRFTPDVPVPRKRSTVALAFWDFPACLTICLILAELAARAEQKPHATWIVLTVVLVMQRDRATSMSRTVQRGFGTFLGVGLGGLVLLGSPDGVLIAVVALIGAVRGHLKIANYLAYAVVMTPLVLIFLGAGRPTSTSLLVERAGDTAVGCAIAILVGQLIWPLAVRRLPRTDR